MEYAVKRIGVLTSGGDAPGMNAAIRAVARTATRLGIECVGIRRGWNGLINGDILPLDAGSVRSIINRGGTMLYTARSEEFRTEEGQKKAANTCKLLGLDGIVAIGGDGTFRGAQDLSRFGVSVVGVPGTIDNDIVCTDYTIGFDTAANTAVECIDRLRDTMQSHERCSVVEVMGRHAGYLGAASAVEVGRQIQEELGLDPRVTILGHIQRGGSPTAKDRVMATRMGYEAVHLLAAGKTNRVVCARGDSIVDVDINDGLAMHKTLNSEEYEVMEAMTGI